MDTVFHSELRMQRFPWLQSNVYGIKVLASTGLSIKERVIAAKVNREGNPVAQSMLGTWQIYNSYEM